MTGSPSLHRRAFPLAVAVGLIAMGTIVADAVCGSQLLALAGPLIVSITLPLSGLAIGVAALVQFSFIDHKPRLTVLRKVGLGYAAVFSVALMLAMMDVVPVVTITAVWLLSDQINVILPVLLWSLAGDVFNTAEGKRVFGWMMGWSYAAQVIGLALAIFSPMVLSRLGVPLPGLLFVSPLACIVIAVWIPRSMRGAAVGRGLPKGESTRVALAGALQFIRGVPAWRALVLSTTLASIAVLTAWIGFLTTSESIIGADAGHMQSYFALAYLAILLAGGLFQWQGADRLNRRVGVAGQFTILPVAVIIGGLLIALADPMWSLALLLIGMTVVDFPFFSVDENARHAALTFIPDQLRARVALITDLGRFSVGFVVAGLLALVGTTLGAFWLSGVVAAVIGGVALAWAIAITRRWDASMLNWRLRRRKSSLLDELTWDEQP